MAAKTRKRRWWRLVLLALPLLTVLAFGTLTLAASCRPGWYQPESIDFARLPADKQQFVAITEQIGRALNTGQPIELQLDSQQVNRWLTARRELVADQVDFLPAEFERPVVRFEESGRVQLAATVAARGARFVASLLFEPSVTPDGESVGLRLREMRIGRVQAPDALVKRLLEQAWPASQSEVEIGGTLVRRDPNEPLTWVIDNRFLWRNGRRWFRVAELKVEAGQLRAKLVPTR